MTFLIEKFKKYFNSRKNNYAFWVSLVSAVLVFLTSIGLKVDNDIIMNVVKSFLGIMVVLGIVNNPTTTNSGFADDNTKSNIVS